MKISSTLRTQVFIMMTFLVILQSGSLLLALRVSRIYTTLDTKSFQLLQAGSNGQAQAFHHQIEDITSSVNGEAEFLSRSLRSAAIQGQTQMKDLVKHDDSYVHVISAGADAVIRLLQNTNVSGAYFILDASYENPDNPDAHSAVFIRNFSPQSAYAQVEWFLLDVGSADILQDYHITHSTDWRSEWLMDDPVREKYDFYDKPILASRADPTLTMQQCGYWSTPSDTMPCQDEAIRYTLPLLDGQGEAFGVLGVEITLPVFNRNYFPHTQLGYQDSFSLVAQVKQQQIKLNWFIPSAPVANYYLKDVQSIALTPAAGTQMYQTSLAPLGEVYCYIQPLYINGAATAFSEENWSLITFVPCAQLHAHSDVVRANLILSVSLTTILTVIVVFVISHISTRKILALSKELRALKPAQSVHLKRTGLREIDELCLAVELLSENLLSAAKTTSRLLSLTLLPIGGFEIYHNTEQVVLTEYIYHLLGLPENEIVQKDTWDARFAALTADCSSEYENVFHYQNGARGMWLRILTTQTPESTIGVIVDVSEEIDEKRRLVSALDYDQLTNLLNRKAFKHEVFARVREQPDKVGAMIFSDLDNLKYINDIYGHDMGDQMLVRAGEMFRSFAQFGGIVSRISGDEFAIFLYGGACVEQLRCIIEQQFKRFEDVSFSTCDGKRHRIRCSTGIAWYPQDSNDIADLIKLSDYAMYEAKHKQKGRLFEFNHESYKKNHYLLENREAINALLEDELLAFAFQPIVSLVTGEIYGYEALMRSLHSDFKSPFEILAVAAAQSKLGQLDQLVFHRVAAIMNGHEQGFGEQKIFINSVPSQTLTQESFPWARREFAPYLSNLVIELTETDNEPLEAKLDSIKEHGMLLALDDFGSGYSNEIRILTLAPDIVKLDRELITNIHKDPYKQELVYNIVTFCHRHPKNIRLVAEGVELAEELAAVSALGVDYVQGFYVQQPYFGFVDIPSAMKAEIQEIYHRRTQIHAALQAHERAR